MPFAIKERPNFKPFQKTEYLALTPGTHVVRFLEPTEAAHYDVTHFLVTNTGRFSILCLGDECPVCNNNRKIILENPKNFRTVAGYSPKSDRYTLNVYDRTLVKTCPNCSAENAKNGNVFPPVCTSCNAVISSVKEAPSGKVKLLQISRTAAQQLNDIELNVRGADGEPLPITAYDMVFSVSMSNGKKTITQIPSPSSNDVVSVEADKLLNKDSAMKLSAGEVLDLLKGISLKDIFAARKAAGDANKDAVQPTVTPPSEAVDTSQAEIDIQKKIAELYGE